MRGGGALILWALAACLEPAPAGPASGTGMRSLTPLNEQEALEATRAPAVRGRFLGRCAGPVLLQAVSGNQERPLAASSEAAGRDYVFYLPAADLDLRWGCDADGDGVVPPELTATARLSALARDLPLDLRLIEPDRLQGFDVALARNTRRPLLPAGGAAGPALEGLPPPDAAAPADGAVGPPLPEGPPADAGPPPPTGVGPPI